MKGNEPPWDLSQLVKRTDAFSIQNMLDSMLGDAENLRGIYREKIGRLDSKGVLELLHARDDFNLKFEGATLYCKLKYLADSTDPTARQLNDASRRASMQANQTLAFIDIELGRLLIAKPSLVSDPILSEFRHYLERKLRKAPHMLSESDGRLIIGKDKNGISAWQMLQSEWISTRTFEFEVDGVKRTLAYGEITSYYQAPDRDLRRRSYQTVYETLGKDNILFASALRSICEDHLLMCNWRKYSSPLLPSLIDNDVDQEAIDILFALSCKIWSCIGST